MYTIVETALELAFYLFKNITKKEEISKAPKLKLVYSPVIKSGVVLIPRRDKPPLYSIKLPDKDILIENLKFESTADVGVATNVKILGLKQKESTLYLSPTEVFSKDFLKELIQFLKEEKGEKND